MQQLSLSNDLRESYNFGRIYNTATNSMKVPYFQGLEDIYLHGSG